MQALGVESLGGKVVTQSRVRAAYWGCAAQNTGPEGMWQLCPNQKDGALAPHKPDPRDVSANI